MALVLDYKRADRVATVEVQDALRRKGYAPGPVDGRFGVQTMRAVVKFQSDNGMTPTGAVDESLFGAITAPPAPPAAKPAKKKAAAKPAAKKAAPAGSGAAARKGRKA